MGIHNLLQAYVFHNNQSGVIQAIDSCKQRYAPQLQQACYAVVIRTMTPRDGGYRVIAPEAFELSHERDDSLRYFASLMFGVLHSLLQNNQLYTLKVKELGY